MFGKHGNPISISELFDARFDYARFHEGDGKHHYDAEGLRGELKGSSVEVLKHFLDKRMKGKKSPPHMIVSLRLSCQEEEDATSR